MYDAEKVHWWALHYMLQCVTGHVRNRQMGIGSGWPGDYKPFSLSLSSGRPFICSLLPLAFYAPPSWSSAPALQNNSRAAYHLSPPLGCGPQGREASPYLSPPSSQGSFVLQERKTLLQSPGWDEPFSWLLVPVGM